MYVLVSLSSSYWSLDLLLHRRRSTEHHGSHAWWRESHHRSHTHWAHHSHGTHHHRWWRQSVHHSRCHVRRRGNRYASLGWWCLCEGIGRDLSGLVGSRSGVNQVLGLVLHPLLVVEFHIVLKVARWSSVWFQVVYWVNESMKGR